MVCVWPDPNPVFDITLTCIVIVFVVVDILK